MTTDPSSPSSPGGGNGGNPSPPRRPAARWAVPVVIALLVAIVVVVLVSRGSSPSDEQASSGDAAATSTGTTPDTTETTPATPKADFTGSGYPNGDLRNMRRTRGPITTKTVKRLEQAWSHPIDGAGNYGSYAATPVIDKGVIYSQDLASNVEAIDLKTGETLWRTAYNLPSAGPNGLVVADGRVYAATPTAAFALDEATGEELWSVPLTKNEADGIDMAPGYHDGLVYVSTVPVSAQSPGYSETHAGTLYALDAKTGKKRWSFNTIKAGGKGKRGKGAGGGLWYTPAFDDDGGMYFGVGNPSPWPGTAAEPFGSGRPGANLYTNSLVKLDAKTGKLRWYYQETPHDIYDWDLQGPPILVNRGGRKLAIIGGKSGFVIATDQKTGEVVWRKSVGRHNGHDKDGLLAMRGKEDDLETGVEIYPGILGGVISPMSSDGKRVFAAVVDNPATLVDGATLQGSPDMSGELVALDVATGKRAWRKKLPSVSFGATSVSNDVVFATTMDGRVLGFDADSGKQVWDASLGVGTNAGIVVEGGTLVAPAGMATQAGQTPQIVAFRLPRSR
ncbi:MAG: PQQ-binding-like beta-propeller repeat protein [Patulibacter sp.]|nr:PQQ-binding-like beta-propeller repeat protein [Patulibacter sp.]